MGIREAIVDAAERRNEGLRISRLAMLELEQLAREARRENIPIAEIARLAGITRQTVYTMIGGKGQKR